MNDMDENIIKALQSSDRKKHDRQLKKLYVTVYPNVRSFILKNNGTIADAADIFQDSIIVFYNKVQKKDFVLTCTIQTYLVSVSRNLWFNRIRKLKKKASLESIDQECNQDILIVDQIMKDERNEVISSMVEQLGEKCQQVLEQYYYRRMRMKDIATYMGLENEQVAKNRKSRCLKKLRQLVNLSNFLIRN